MLILVVICRKYCRKRFAESLEENKSDNIRLRLRYFESTRTDEGGRI
jgi:hypothetical protein